MKEGYIPTPEEIKLGEDMVTPEQKASKREKMFIPRGTTDRGKFHAQFYSGMYKREFCPVHKKEEWGSDCPFLSVIQTPAEYSLVVTDQGGSRDLAPLLPGWEAIQSKGTHGRAHEYITYARQGLSAYQLVEYLKDNIPSECSKVELEGQKVTIWSSQLGLWIGKNGRWAKAYQKLGIKVDFKELKEVNLKTLLNDKEQEVREKAVVAPFIRKKDFGVSEIIVGLFPSDYNLIFDQEKSS